MTFIHGYRSNIPLLSGIWIDYESNNYLLEHGVLRFYDKIDHVMVMPLPAQHSFRKINRKGRRVTS